MPRTAKIAGVAALAGLMMTVAIAAAVQPDEPAPAPPLVLSADDGQARLARELDRFVARNGDPNDAGCETAKGMKSEGGARIAIATSLATDTWNFISGTRVVRHATHAAQAVIVLAPWRVAR